MLWWALAALVIGAVGIAAPQTSRGVKGWQARRLVNQAVALIEQQNWPEAAKKIQRSFQLRSTEPEVWRVTARLLSRTGHEEAAIDWWRRVAQSSNLSLDDRRDYTGAALSTKELAEASEQLEILLSQKSGPTSKDLLLAEQLATLRGHSSSALSYAERILSDEATDPLTAFGATTLVLANTTPESKSYTTACQRMAEIARDETNPACLQALVFLANAPAPASSADISVPHPVAAPPEIFTNAIPAGEIADRLETHPDSRPYHRMLAFELRARIRPSLEDVLIEKAVTLYGQGDDDALIALSAWLHERHRFESILQVLPPDRAARRSELLVERIDALGALDRFAELKEMLLTEQPALDQSFQHMYLAMACSKLGETVFSANEWHRALEAADNTQKLLSLADYAGKSGAPEIADAAYARTVAKQPGLRGAYTARLRLLENSGQTAEAHGLLVQMVQMWPEDTAARIHETYLRLLIGASSAEAKAAEEEAKAFSDRNPRNIGARMTLALARLKQGRHGAALAAVSEKGGDTANRNPLAVRAAALAANGWTDEARLEAQKLVTVDLLPEERALIAPLLAAKK